MESPRRDDRSCFGAFPCRSSGWRQGKSPAGAVFATTPSATSSFLQRCRRSGNRSSQTFRKLLAAILLSACTIVAIPGHASEAILEALLERGLAPFAPWYAAEIDYAWQGNDGAMPGTGYRVQLPQDIPSGLALIGGPDGAVIADVVEEPGTLALSAEVARAIGLGRGRQTTISVIALRRITEASLGSHVGELGGAVVNSPVPRPRPQFRETAAIVLVPRPRSQISKRGIIPPVPIPRPATLSP
jgi:hypothetical protein